MWNDAKTLPLLRERAKHIRLIATDLDGTLLDGTAALTERTAQALDMVRARGIAFTVCTGRSFYELGDLPQKLGLDRPVICRNGAEVVDPVSGETLFRRLIPAREGAAFLRFCLQEGVDVCLTTQDRALMPRDSAFAGFFTLMGQTSARVALLEDTPALETLEYYKIILLRDQPKHTQAVAFAEKLSSAQVIGAGDAIDDVISRDADKGDGLRWVAEHLGAGREGCCAFGDFSNDIPMLQYAHLSFAMENAAADVRAAADYVAPPNTADGVAQVLETLFGA